MPDTIRLLQDAFLSGKHAVCSSLLTVTVLADVATYKTAGAPYYHQVVPTPVVKAALTAVLAAACCPNSSIDVRHLY